MAAAAPVHTTAMPRDRKSRDWLTSWVSTKDCAHALKLRHSVKIDPRTRLELGLDLDLVDSHGLRQTLQNSAPWAAMLHQFDEGDAGKGAIELNPLFLSYNKKYQIGKEGEWWGVPLDTKLGVTFTGKPHVEVGIGNLPLALTVATLLLATGKTVSLKRKEVGSLAVHFPLTAHGVKYDHSLQERLEVDATLRAEGRGLRLDFQQLSGVLRLRQD